MKNQFRTFALLAGAAVMGSGALHAAEIYSEKTTISFPFRVSNATLPAGTYRVETSFGTDVAMLVNVDTGRRVQFLRHDALREEGKIRMIFKTSPDGTVLKDIQ